MGKIITSLVIFALFGCALSLKYFNLRNFNDGGYLQISSAYEDCLDLASVNSSLRLDTTKPNWNRWIWLEADRSGWGYLIVDDESKELYEYNEVTRWSNSACRKDLHQFSQMLTRMDDHYYLFSKLAEKCLTSNGTGTRVSYQPCDLSDRQIWEFIPA